MSRRPPQRYNVHKRNDGALVSLDLSLRHAQRSDARHPRAAPARDQSEPASSTMELDSDVSPALTGISALMPTRLRSVCVIPRSCASTWPRRTSTVVTSFRGCEQSTIRRFFRAIPGLRAFSAHDFVTGDGRVLHGNPQTWDTREWLPVVIDHERHDQRSAEDMARKFTGYELARIFGFYRSDPKQEAGGVVPGCRASQFPHGCGDIDYCPNDFRRAASMSHWRECPRAGSSWSDRWRSRPRTWCLSWVGGRGGLG